MTVKEGE